MGEDHFKKYKRKKRSGIHPNVMKEISPLCRKKTQISNKKTVFNRGKTGKEGGTFNCPKLGMIKEYSMSKQKRETRATGKKSVVPNQRLY